MRSSTVGARRRWGAARSLAAAGCAIAGLTTGCPGAFDGPYPCESGFASCVDPQADRCETDIARDSLNCGACGVACPLGAACTNSKCGPPAVRLATLSQPVNQRGALEVNATAVFWMDTGGAQPAVLSVPIAGGLPTTVATGLLCSSGGSFAVDDANLYYVSMGNGQTSGQGTPGNNGGVIALPLLGGTPTVLVSDDSGSTFSNCPAMAVDATNLYLLAPVAQAGTQNVTSLVDVAIAGGATTTLATSPDYASDELAITPTRAIVQANNNGLSSYAAIPLAGGPAVQVPASSSEGGGTTFTADAANIYTVGSSCSCSNTGAGYSGPPAGQVVMLPIDGGAPAILAQFTGAASSIAVDSRSVYWSTDTAVWKVPIAGGPVSAVAGGLTTVSNEAGGPHGYQCSGCGGSPAGVTTLIAVDATSVYIADFASDVDAILEVPK